MAVAVARNSSVADGCIMATMIAELVRVWVNLYFDGKSIVDYLGCSILHLYSREQGHSYIKNMANRPGLLARPSCKTMVHCLVSA